jgi:hypothetical protein
MEEPIIILPVYYKFIIQCSGGILAAGDDCHVPPSLVTRWWAGPID